METVRKPADRVLREGLKPIKEWNTQTDPMESDSSVVVVLVVVVVVLLFSVCVRQVLRERRPEHRILSPNCSVCVGLVQIVVLDHYGSSSLPF